MTKVKKSLRYIPSDKQAATGLQKAMKQAGIITEDQIFADGKIHRFHVLGDKDSSKNGWYILFSGGIAAGSFGCWKRQISEIWCSKDDFDLTPEEREENKRRMEAARKARDKEEERRHGIGRKKAQAIWEASVRATKHAYLDNKGVKSYGLRIHEKRLAVPVQDTEGNIRSLQFINKDGEKRFLSGGKKEAGYFPIGAFVDCFCVCEGYATGASIHEATGLPVAVAFDAGNLMPVCLELRTKFPTAKIILCADNDSDTPGNPGLTKATAAAQAIGGHLAIPPCAGDFNDFIERY